MDIMLKWGIAGVGNIAKRVAGDFQYINNGILHAVASRSRQKAQDFASGLNITKAFASYADMANDSEIDAVYVATIHPFHFPVAKLFLESGKHVLIEKPAVINAEQWQELVDIAEKNQCFLMEAMKFPLFPAYRQLKQFLIKESVHIHKITAHFGNAHSFDPNWHLFNKSLYGGAKYDVGCYLLWLYVDLLRITSLKNIKVSRTESTLNKCSNVDERCNFTFIAPSLANLHSSIVDNYPKQATIETDKTHITIHGKWWNPKRVTFSTNTDYQPIDFTQMEGAGFQYEFDHFAQCIKNGLKQSPIISHNKSAIVLQLLE